MKHSTQSAASLHIGTQSLWSDDTLKKVKARRQQVWNNIKNRDEFVNIAMDLVLEKTNFQRVFKILFEGQKLILFDRPYINFWELGLQIQNIKNYRFEDWNPKPPQLLDDLEELSNFPLCTQRLLIGEKPLKVVLPFVPKFIHYKEICRLYILDNTEAWYTGESIVLNKIPMSSIFTFKQCFMIKALSESTVQVQFKWYVDFHEWTALKGTIISSTKDEINTFVTKFFAPSLENVSSTGILIPTEDDIFRAKPQAKDDSRSHLEPIEARKSNFVEEFTPNKFIKEIIPNAPVRSGDKIEGVDPLDEPIRVLLKEIQDKNQRRSSAISDSANILKRLYCPKYKGDMIFIVLIIISLANLSRVLFF